MGMTRTQKILARHAGRPEVEEGELLVSQVDLTLANDITGPPAIDEFDKIGRPVFNKDKIALVPDHFSPPKDIKSATLCKHMRDFARKHNITNYFEVGRMGIEHALVPDSGLVAPGELVIGADSHTCTYGALAAFATGVGSTEMAGVLATGQTWMKVPQTIRVIWNGELPERVMAKDISLKTIGAVGHSGATYKTLEYAGDTIQRMMMDERLCLTNMAVEAGAKAGIVGTTT